MLNVTASKESHSPEYSIIFQSWNAAAAFFWVFFLYYLTWNIIFFQVLCFPFLFIIYSPQLRCESWQRTWWHINCSFQLFIHICRQKRLPKNDESIQSTQFGPQLSFLSFIISALWICINFPQLPQFSVNNFYIKLKLSSFSKVSEFVTCLN